MIQVVTQLLAIVGAIYLASVCYRAFAWTLYDWLQWRRVPAGAARQPGRWRHERRYTSEQAAMITVLLFVAFVLMVVLGIWGVGAWRG